jgi:error-prone DNA polymerase
LGIAEDILSRFSDLFPHGDFHHTLELLDQIRRAGLEKDHARLPALMRLNKAVYGLPRHLGQHSGGMVLCTQGLDSIVPLEPASMPGRTVVQWDKDDCEDLGIIKVDLLGLGMMAVLEETVALCRDRGPDRDKPMEEIPADDKETYEMIQKAETIGVFQIESRAQQATLPRLRPDKFYDLVIEVAIIRPGPIVGKLVHPYLKRKAEKRLDPEKKFDCIDPKFEGFLDRTLGVPLFQEQILQMAMAIAGFSGAQADELRRAMSFHRSEERMNSVLKKLSLAMDDREVSPETQEKVVSAIESFALYGFPESHAIGFAMLAYSSSWYRVHRLAEFTVALLNNQPMGFYSSSTLVRDAKLRGLRVLPVCLKLSEVKCIVVDDHTIRLGLNQVHGLSAASAEKLIAQRRQQPWQSMEDFMLRCPLPRDERRVLARSGALNALATHRRTALWEVEKEREPDLFSYSKALEKEVSSPLQSMTLMERIESDFQTLHLTTGPHPMALKRHELEGITVASQLHKGKHGQSIVIAGKVICRQRPGTAKGHVFISLEDETGIANAFVHSSLFERERLVINQEGFLKIKGRLQIVDNVISVYAQKIEALQYDIALDARSHDYH